MPEVPGIETSVYQSIWTGEEIDDSVVKINAHIIDEERHITNEEREKWNKGSTSNRPREWGVRFALEEGSPTGERLGDAVGLVTEVGTDTEGARNDFDFLPPWQSRRVNGYWEGKRFIVTAAEGEPNFAVDGSNGNVYAERHLFYYKYVFLENENNGFEVWISDQPQEGYSIPERFKCLDGSILQCYYYPCYMMSEINGKPVSVSGKNTMINKSYSQLRQSTQALGKGYSMETTKDRDINQLLFWVEFATLDSQSVMYGAANMRYGNAADVATVATENGNEFICANATADQYVVGQTISIGTTQNSDNVAKERTITSIDMHDGSNKSIKFDGATVTINEGNFITSRAWFSGKTDSVKTPSGSPTDNQNGKYPCRYRYVENLWGNQWSFLGDVISKDFRIYVCNDPTKFASEITSDYQSVNYKLPESADRTFFQTLGYDSNFPATRLPETLGGTAGTYFGDTAKVLDGTRSIEIGGAIDWSENGGLSAITTEYALDGRFSARLSYTAVEDEPEYSMPNHNGIYRGKDITDVYSIDQLAEKVSKGDFSGLYLGDYFTVHINTTLPDETQKEEDVQLMIAAFDYYLNSGDIALTKHHLVLIPRNGGFTTTAKMNDTNTTDGGYLNSYMHKTVLPCYAASLKTALKNHLLSHKELLTSVVNTTAASAAGAGFVGSASGWEWATVELCLMNEVQVYGTTAFSSSAYDVGNACRQLPVFRFVNPVQFGRIYFWLRCVVSSTFFARCNSYGHADSGGASGALFVRPLILFG